MSVASQLLTGEFHSSAGAANRSDGHQHAIDAGTHAVDALRKGDRSHALPLTGVPGAGAVESGSEPLGNIARRLP